MTNRQAFFRRNGGLKKRILKCFILFACLEFCCNLYLNRYYFDLTFLPFLGMVLAQRYLPFNRGCLCFTLGFLCYFQGYPFPLLTLSAVAVSLFALTHKVTNHRLAMASALLIQLLIFVALDPVFNTVTLLQSLCLTLLSFYLLPLGIFFPKRGKKETIFIGPRSRYS
jgi:hypothetical protein